MQSFSNPEDLRMNTGNQLTVNETVERVRR